jgi:hypothetical protein
MLVRWPAMESERFSMPGMRQGFLRKASRLTTFSPLFSPSPEGRGRCGVLKGVVGAVFLAGVVTSGGGGVELQAELYRGVEEAFDRRERDDQRFGDAVERETDFEGGFVDLEVPVLVLDDDRHFLVVLTEQFLAEANAGGARHEGNEEVVVTGKPGLGNLGQNLAHDAAQGFLGENVVSHMIFGHDYPSCAWGSNPERPISASRSMRIQG